MKFFDYNLYEKLPKYQGKDKFHIHSASHRAFSIIICVFMSLPIFVFNLVLLFTRNLTYEDLFSAFAPLLLIFAFFFFLVKVSHRKIIINKSGVSLKSSCGRTIKHFDWDNIEHIHVLLPINSLTPPYKFYISTDPMPKLSLGSNTVNSSEYMVISYKPEIIHCILQFWDKKIGNYDEPKSWEKYVNKL